jgi:DeoR/GlpR family transcriptional regulator of sugar metabolism
MRLQLDPIFAKYYFRNSCIHLEIEHFKCFEVSINYIMIKVAEQVVIMAEVKKMNSRGFSKIEILITDDGVNVETK